MNHTGPIPISTSAPIDKEATHLDAFLSRLRELNSQANDLQKSLIGALERYNGGEPEDSCTLDLSNNLSFSFTRHSLDKQLDTLEETLGEMKKGLSALNKIM